MWPMRLQNRPVIFAHFDRRGTIPWARGWNNYFQQNDQVRTLH